jgi:hypothetical protein
MPRISRLPQPAQASPDASPGLTPEKASDIIKMLFSALSAPEQERVLQDITAAVRPIAAPRAGEVLGAIVRLLPQQREWTVDEVKQEVLTSGVTATAKEVYNAVGYLVRRGHIKRVGYGRYLCAGALMVTADDFGDQPLPTEDD